jgi:hypothetical protein
VRHVLLLIGLAALTRPTHADPARRLSQRGQELARNGRLTDAIDVFKQADRLAPRARHACLIGLAYLRRELWTQAELYLERCRERATRRDPAPDWLPLAEQQLRRRSAHAQLAPIDVRVEPASVSAAIEFSSFALGEQFAPGQVRLPRGLHVLTATAPSRPSVHAVVEVTDTSARSVVLRFTDDPAPRASYIPTALAALGGTTLAAGLGYHVFAHDEQRPLTYALYGAGGAALAGALVLRYTLYRSAPERAPRVLTNVGGDATTLALEWQR